MAKKKKLRTKSKSQTKPLRIPGTRSHALTPEELTPAEEYFCQWFVQTGNAFNAAQRAGYHPAYGWQLKQRDAIKERILALQKEKIDETQRFAQQEFVMEASALDMSTVYISTRTEPHPLLGYRDQLIGLKLGYQRLKLIEAPGVRINNGAQAQVTNGQAVGLPLELSYRPRWLLKTEARLAKKFEEEVASGRTIEGTATVPAERR